MASTFFRNFAIENNLTVDYGYMYGKYKGFFITLKETLGSTKVLSIYTTVGKDKEMTKKILSCFTQEELPKYCITNFKVSESDIQFTFELVGDKVKFIVEFLDKFIKSFADNGNTPGIICPICNKKINDDEETSIIDKGGNLVMAHSSCFDKGKKEAEEKQKQKEIEEEKAQGKDKTYLKGLAGAAIFGVIYMLLLGALFYFMQFILQNADDDDSFVTIFQYLPVLGGLAACPIIYYGYDVMGGKKGTSKYLVILWTVIICSLLGSILGFIFSLQIYTDYSIAELFDIIGILITGSYPSFRYGFYIYIILTLGLSILSMIFKFSGKSDNEQANDSTFEKLD